MSAAALYLIAIWATAQSVPVRLLYEGMAPLPPYRWVRPPTNLANTNELPRPWSDAIPFRGSASQSNSLATGDLQIIAVFRQNALSPHPGESEVRVTLTPLDPMTVGPPPAGLQFDGNAYRVDAVYAGSRERAALREPITVVLRYPRHAEQILRSDNGTWMMTLPASLVPESMQILTSTDRLGVFVAVGPVGSPRSGGWPAYIAAALVLVVAVAAFLLGRRRATR